MNTTHICNDVEACLLNVLFTFQEKQRYIFDNTEASFFENPIYADIFKIAKNIYLTNAEVSNVDVYEVNKSYNKELLEILTQPIAYSSMVNHYCKKLYQRKLKQLISEAKSEEELNAVKEFKNKYGFFDLKIKHISDGAETFEKRYEENKKKQIVSGFYELDEIIGSFMGGDYIALGGSTGMGKTSIALNIANQVCLQGKKVLYCSLEMPIEQLRNRFVCMVMGLNAMKYRACGFTKEEMEKYRIGLNGLNEWNLNVLCDYQLTPDKLMIYAKEQQKQGLDFIILDYLGLMSGYNNKSLYEKSTNLSRQIKLIATELNVPILVLVQLNRDNKERKDKRPVLSDIRESGAIEQDADFVLFAYRDSLYNYQSPTDELEIIVAKNRHGKNNKIAKLNFDLSTQLIRSRYVETAKQNYYWED